MARKSNENPEVDAQEYPETAITGHTPPADVNTNGYGGQTVNDTEDSPTQGEEIDPALEPTEEDEDDGPFSIGNGTTSAEEDEEGEDDWLSGGPSVSDPLGGLAQVPADDGSFLKTGQKKTFGYDFRDVDDGPPRLDPGTYCARLVDVDEEEAKSSGLPQWVWTFQVTKGPKRNFKMKFWTSLSKDARWKAAQTLKALGIKAAGAMGEWQADQVLGKPVKIEVYLDTYQGEQRSKIKTVHPPDEEALLAARDAKDLVP